MTLHAVKALLQLVQWDVVQRQRSQRPAGWPTVLTL